MPVDKLLMANSALGAAYGLQIGLAPAKASETFYGETSPSKVSKTNRVQRSQHEIS